jgi:hypothetical protein
MNSKTKQTAKLVWNRPVVQAYGSIGALTTNVKKGGIDDNSKGMIKTG